MKKVFVFNNSRPTDFEPAFAALVEDGSRVIEMAFTERTAPFYQYVMHLVHIRPEITDERLAETIQKCRDEMSSVLDKVVGSAMWQAVFVSDPMEAEDTHSAILALRERLRERKRARHAEREQMLVSLLGMLATADLPTSAPPAHQH